MGIGGVESKLVAARGAPLAVTAGGDVGRAVNGSHRGVRKAQRCPFCAPRCETDTLDSAKAKQGRRVHGLCNRSAWQGGREAVAIQLRPSRRAGCQGSGRVAGK
eukprot:1796075-Prymnesium_polylepis.2